MIRYVPEELSTDYTGNTNMTEAKQTKNIPEAVCAVMGEIGILDKSMRNKHSGYDFASIDDFLNAVRPLCAKHGFFVLQKEIDSVVVQGEKSLWLHEKFEYTLLHVNGDTLECGYKSVAVPAGMGSQAYGSAQSYGLKQFLRALLMIATGDKGEDEGALVAGDVAPKNSRDPKWDGPLVKGKLTAALAGYCKEIDECDDLNTLLDLGECVAVTAENVGKDYPTDLTFNDVIEQAKHDAPGYLDGKGMPELFIPFNQRMDAAMDRLGANMGET